MRRYDAASFYQVDAAQSEAKLLGQQIPDKPSLLESMQGFMLMFALLANMQKLAIMGPRHDGRTAQIKEVESYRNMAEDHPLIPEWIMDASKDLCNDQKLSSSSSRNPPAAASEKGGAEGSEEPKATTSKVGTRRAVKKGTMQKMTPTEGDSDSKPLQKRAQPKKKANAKAKAGEPSSTAD